MKKKSRVLGGLFGLCIGDALGLPVEGVPRAFLKQAPVKDLGYLDEGRGFPPGWWSDDSSLTFCLTESLSQGFDIDDIARLFQKWLYEGYWTPAGKAFGIGLTTLRSLERIRKGTDPERAGGSDEYSNGNGSLMRILPLAFYLENSTVEERFSSTHSVSCITHAHSRSQIACGIYIELAIQLLQGNDKKSSYTEMKKSTQHYYGLDTYRGELNHFSRILESDISHYNEEEIKSSGYVVDTLEASLFCFFKGESYEDTVLGAVNLGGDTDTTAAVTGGLAGIYYGFEKIPERWVDRIEKRDEILTLAETLYRAVYKKRGC
jgi:ADP-ribosylglycohydrolase